MKPEEKELLIEALKKLIEQCGSQREAAKRLGISDANISEVLSGVKQPGKKMIDGLGFEKVLRKKRK